MDGINVAPFIRLDRLTGFRSDNMSGSDSIEVIVKYNGDIQRVGELTGALTEILSVNYAIMTLPLNRLLELYDYDEIEYIELPKYLTYVLRYGLSSACISPVQNIAGLGLRGQGVIIGIIDSGIDYTHPDFINADGTSRILYIWDQTLPGTPPEGFAYGSEYDNDMINRALSGEAPFTQVPGADIIGHGTAVAGIAAGNGNGSAGLERGVAPEASIIAVKLGYAGSESLTRSTEIMRAVKYISDKAEELRMPLAINISYGTNNGSHDGNSLFERFLDSMAEKWKTVIAVATGNEGITAHHFSATLTRGQTVDVEFALAGVLRTVYITLWKDFVDTVNLELISPGGGSTGIIRPVQSVTRITLDGVGVSVLYGQPNHYRVDQEVYILLQTQNQVISPGVWRLEITGVNIIDGRIDIWLPTGEEVSRETSFLNPSLPTTLTLPSTAHSIIAVGAYNAIVSISADFSGRGPLRAVNITKPDLTAPGVDIYTTRSGGGYDVYTGTSMAVPFVTGSAALMMQWGIVLGNDPFLYGQRVKAFLRRGASRDFPIEYPNNIWGYGTLSLCDTMTELVAYTRTGGAFS
ncbi:MAG: S8 family serine peptidase [Eubacteriales bacterium]|jgi:minor extracellular serine protease Vpr|nr:S8 family serine peptidase [Eubacteriales bacterium]